MERYVKAQRGDAKALTDLFRFHAPLVQSLAKRFEDVQDAFQAGCIGLVKAIRNYDIERGCAFSTYAVPLILGEMRHGREKRFSWRQQKKLNEAQRLRDDMMKREGREPTIREMADKAGIQPADMALLLEGNKKMLYTDATEVFSLPDPWAERWMECFFIRDILERMPQTESYILTRRFMYSESQVSLSFRMHTTQSTLSRREKKARLMFISAWQC